VLATLATGCTVVNPDQGTEAVLAILGTLGVLDRRASDSENASVR
jgi:hypothetical protein